MGVLQRFERRLEGMVGLAFARIFKGKVHPAEIAKALQREADEQRSVVGEGRVLAPNVYVVRLGPTDFDVPRPVVRAAGRRARRHGHRARRRRGLPGLRQGDRPPRAGRRAADRRLRGQLARRRPRAPAPPRGRRRRRAPRHGHPPLPPLPPLRGRIRQRHRAAGPPSFSGRAGSRRVTHVLVVDGPGTRHELGNRAQRHRPRHRGRHPAARHRREPQARRRRPRRRGRHGRGPRLHQRHAGERTPGQPPGARRRRRDPHRSLGPRLPAGRLP